MTTTDTPTTSAAATTRLPGFDRITFADFLVVGRLIGDYRVTYLGPTFLRHFGAVVETDIPETDLTTHRMHTWASDSTVHPEVTAGSTEEPALGRLIQIIERGGSGPGVFNGFSNVLYKTSPVDGQVLTPHFYIRGDRLGFGALAFDHHDGWEPGDHIYL